VLDLRTAGAGSRGIAALIDFAVVWLVLIILLIVVAAVGLSVDSDTEGALSLVVLVAVVLGYPVAMETLWHGRTLGKAAMGLRVVRDDGGPIRFRHAFVRGLVGVVVDKPGITVSVAAFVPMLASARNKRFGDVLAGTIVLSERIPGAVDLPVAMPMPLAGWAAGLDLSGVDDALAMRARQLLQRSRQLSPAALARLQHDVAVDLVARVGTPPADAPEWAVLAAIVAERRRRALLGTTTPPLTPRPPSTPPPPSTSQPPRATGGFAPPG
jgi:uncharacterized RDD family membrane protein YckC